jgi:hypothetical protein
MEKCDMGWDDFLKFLELFFNREMWHGMGWYCMVIEFSKIFLIEKVMWHELIFLNFYNYFLIEKDDVACYLNF